MVFAIDISKNKNNLLVAKSSPDFIHLPILGLPLRSILFDAKEK